MNIAKSAGAILVCLLLVAGDCWPADPKVYREVEKRQFYIGIDFPEGASSYVNSWRAIVIKSVVANGVTALIKSVPFNADGYNAVSDIVVDGYFLKVERGRGLVWFYTTNPENERLLRVFEVAGPIKSVTIEYDVEYMNKEGKPAMMKGGVLDVVMAVPVDDK
jgi:hypothetical protein